MPDFRSSTSRLKALIVLFLAARHIHSVKAFIPSNSNIARRLSIPQVCQQEAKNIVHRVSRSFSVCQYMGNNDFIRRRAYMASTSSVEVDKAAPSNDRSQYSLLDLRRYLLQRSLLKKKNLFC